MTSGAQNVSHALPRVDHSLGRVDHSVRVSHPTHSQPSSISSQAPASEPKSLFAKFWDAVVWFCSGCGMCSSAPRTVPTASRAQTAIVATSQTQTAAAPAVSSLDIGSARNTIQSIEQEITALGPNTPESRHLAKETRWVLYEIRPDLNAADPQHAPLLESFERVAAQIREYTGATGPNLINVAEITTTLNTFEGNIRRVFPILDQAERQREAGNMRAALFLFDEALEPSIAAHIPLRERIQTLQNELDRVLGNTPRLTSIDVDLATRSLMLMDVRSQNLTQEAPERRRAKRDELRSQLFWHQMSIHPQDPRHQALREIAQGIATRLDAIQ